MTAASTSLDRRSDDLRYSTGDSDDSDPVQTLAVTWVMSRTATAVHRYRRDRPRARAPKAEAILAMAAASSPIIIGRYSTWVVCDRPSCLRFLGSDVWQPDILGAASRSFDCSPPIGSIVFHVKRFVRLDNEQGKTNG